MPEVSQAAGPLIHRVAIEQPTPRKDATGQNRPLYSTAATVWAEVKPLTGRQLALAQANTITQLSTTQITMHYRDGIQTGRTRIRFGSLPLDFLNLTAAQFDALTAADFSALVTAGGGRAPRYFTINDVTDPDERRIKLVLTCTEITA